MNPKQKWVLESGVFFPIPGDTTLHSTPGMGIFEVHAVKSMSGVRIGLRKIDEEFDAYTYQTSISSPTGRLVRNQQTSQDTILTEPDDLGFFTIKRNYSETIELACVINYRSAPSLYQGEI